MRNLILSLIVLFTISNISYAQTVSPDSLLDGSLMTNTISEQENKQVEKIRRRCTHLGRHRLDST